MSKIVDVAIAFYGKPMQTIVAIKSLLQYSGQHIDKIYLTHEQFQPHEDWGGIYKVIDYFKQESVNFIIHRPLYFLSTNVTDVTRTVQNKWYRQSIMYQYALEKTDKLYLCIIHNDMLFHADIIGPMLAACKDQPSVAGAGAIGQCWACPAAFEKLCSPLLVYQYRPKKNDLLALLDRHDMPRKQRDIEIVENGRVWPLPECRLNEHAALINVNLYRAQTLPAGDVGCLGGTWDGADLGMIWFYEMMNRGYLFKHFPLETYALHAPFDDSGSGSMAYTKGERYWHSERLAKEYIDMNYSKKAVFTKYVKIRTSTDTIRRYIRLSLLRAVGAAKKLAKIRH